jgi:hypothetical protein
MKPKSPAQKFHAMREFEDLGSLSGIVTRIGQISRHPTMLPGEVQILMEAVDGIKFLINNWKANTETARERFMKGAK